MYFNINDYNAFRARYFPNHRFSSPRGQTHFNYNTPSFSSPSQTPINDQRTEAEKDQFVAKQFSGLASLRKVKKQPNNSQIAYIRQKFKQVLGKIAEVKNLESHLQENLNASEDEWERKFMEINELKSQIDAEMTFFNDGCLETLRNSLAKRSAKRLREKNVRIRRKKEKEEELCKWEECGRAIDEKIQKINDSIAKEKHERNLRIEADSILRDVLRMKLDAKKYLSKLEALQKLYRARENSHKGRGHVTKQHNATTFKETIGKLTIIWEKKLKKYEQEEEEVRAKLLQDSENSIQNPEHSIQQNIESWNMSLFGTKNAPQRNFNGDFDNFVSVRSEWDKFVSNEGTPIPTGWVVPKKTYSI